MDNGGWLLAPSFKTPKETFLNSSDSDQKGMRMESHA